MWSFLPFLLALVILAFGFVALRSFLFARRPDVPTNTRRLSLALGCACIAFLAIASQGFAHQAVRRGWLSLDVREWLFTWGTFILGSLILALAIMSLWLQARVFSRVQRDETLVSVMIQSPVLDVKTSELSLTAREMEVLETMASGNVSDEEIASAFFISPATAATHVRNILRKADLHSRRDLVLLYSATQGNAGRDGTAQASPT